MNFLAPLGFLWLASIPVLIWLWRLSASRRRVLISSLVPFEHLLRRAPQRRRRLVVNALFWLQFAALLLATLALAQPLLMLPRGRTILVVFDTSASMGARTNGRSAIDQARREFKAAMTKRLPAEKFFIVATSPITVLTPEPTNDAAELSQLLRRLRVSDLAGHLGRSAQLARAFLGKDPVETWFVTDEPVASGQATDNMRVISVGNALPNVAITGFDAQGELCRKAPLHLTVNVQNFSEEQAPVTLIAKRDGRQIAHTSITLPKESLRRASLALPQGATGWLEVRLKTPRDALSVDNQVWVQIRQGASTPIAVISDDAAFRKRIQEWIQACEGLLAKDVYPATSEPYIAVTDKELAPRALLAGVLRIRRPSESSPVMLAHWQSEIGHPVTSYLAPIEAVAAQVDMTKEALCCGKGLVWAFHHGRRIPVVLADESGAHKVVSMLVDPSAAPVSTPLVLLFFNSLRWLIGQSDIVRTGEPLLIDSLPSGFVHVQEPHGGAERLAHKGGRFRYDATIHSGLYRFSSGNIRITRAVNFLDPVESNLSNRISTWQAGYAAPLSASNAAAPRHPIAKLLVAILLGLILLEWWRYSARSRSRNSAPHT